MYGVRSSLHGRRFSVCGAEIGSHQLGPFAPVNRYGYGSTTPASVPSTNSSASRYGGPPHCPGKGGGASAHQNSSHPPCPWMMTSAVRLVAFRGTVTEP